MYLMRATTIILLMLTCSTYSASAFDLLEGDTSISKKPANKPDESSYYKFLSEQNSKMMDVAIKSSEQAAKAAESRFQNLSYLVGIIGALAVGFMSLIGFRQISAIRTELKGDTETLNREIRAAIADFSSKFESQSSDARRFMSDLDNQLSSRIRSTIYDTSENESLSKDLASSRQLAQEYANEIEKLKLLSVDLDQMRNAAIGTSDYIGGFRIVREQFTKSRKTDVRYSSDTMRLRSQWKIYLENLLVGAEQKDVDSNTLFNASGFAAELGFHALAINLSEKCVELDDSVAHEVQYVRFMLERDKAQRPRLYEKLISLVGKAELPGSEIVYNEVWNAAEHLRRYRPAIEAFEAAISDRGLEKKYFPSYGHVVLARLYSREGDFKWREKMDAQIYIARSKLAQESPNSTWYERAKELIVSVSEESTA